MQENVGITPSDIDGDVIADALDSIAGNGLKAISSSLQAVRDAGHDLVEEAVQPVLIEAVFQLLEAIENEGLSFAVADAVESIDPAAADLAANMLVMANCPDGEGSLAELNDGTVLLLTLLTNRAGRIDEALDFLARAESIRLSRKFEHEAFNARCRIMDNASAIVDLMLARLVEDCDFPEIWADMPQLIERYPDIADELQARVEDDLNPQVNSILLHAIGLAVKGSHDAAVKLIEPLATQHSLSPLVQGAMFNVQSLMDPKNPAFDLASRTCATPFEVIDVLDGGSHLCCASWLTKSVGNMGNTDWQDVWNSFAAQEIRESIHDGSYRFCNKTACPRIMGNTLPTHEQLAARSDKWRDIVENKRADLPFGPYRVNLAYDQTCNLSCPSCRTEKIASDAATRERFSKMQEDNILPLLKETKLVFITGSGDPFASKNFRQLLERLGPEDYPELRFQIMTNGMLFNRREWDRFPALHDRVAFLRISIDAATGPTHELLRRGARWPVMQENLAFAAELRAEGLVQQLDLAFTVQVDNYREMGDAVDLGRKLGADHVDFLRLTNWGTFTTKEYEARAVFMPSHPQHAEFVEVMQDERLQDPIVTLNDLSAFVKRT